MAQKKWKTRIYYSLFAAVPSVLAISVYSYQFNSDIITILTPSITYNHGFGIWGYTYFLKLAGELGIFGRELINWMIGNGRWVTLGIMGFFYWRQPRDWPVMKRFLVILLSFYAFTHAFSIQYLSWVIPFAIIAGQPKWLKRFTLAAAAYMILAYFTLILIFRIDRILPWPQADLALIIPTGLPIWIISIAWLSSVLKSIKREPDVQHSA